MRVLNEQDYALLSDHVYGNEKTKRLELNNKGETTLNGITYEVIKQQSNPQNGYFGAIYRRVDTNELIVVHRGTDDAKDGKTDMLMLRDKYNRQFPDADKLTQQANKLAASDYPNTRIYQTGHSLGGTLAQMCGYKYSQQTQTYNAYGAAELIEMRGINNPHAYQLIINHRMGGDTVSSASPHLGREILYAKETAINELKANNYGNNNLNDNRVYLAMAATRKNHSISNFTDEGGMSVLSPHSQSRRLAQDNASLFEEFRRDVQKTAKESPDSFELLFDLTEKWISENRQYEPLGHENPSKYAENIPKSLNYSDMPAHAQELCRQCREHLVNYYHDNRIAYTEEQLDRTATALGVAGYANKMPAVQGVNITAEGQIFIGHETQNRVLTYASMDAAQAAVIPVADSIAQSKQMEIDLARAHEQRQQEILAYQQSPGISMGRSI